MIRQAISCDICRTEKRQTNHWFVALEAAGELRISGWKSRNRTRPGAKHLCGQTCLHKLMDDFMARDVAANGMRDTAEGMEATTPVRLVQPAVLTDTSLTADAAYDADYLDSISSARLVPTPDTVLPCPAALVPMPVRTQPEKFVQLEEPIPIPSHNRHAEAWSREQRRVSESVR